MCGAVKRGMPHPVKKPTLFFFSRHDSVGKALFERIGDTSQKSRKNNRLASKPPPSNRRSGDMIKPDPLGMPLAQMNNQAALSGPFGPDDPEYPDRQQAKYSYRSSRYIQ
jgi:hypothetical protein